MAQIFQGGTLKGETHFFGDHRAAGEDRDVLKHGLPTIAEARRLRCSHLHHAAHVVHHEGCEGLAFHVLSNHEEGTAGLRHGLEDRQHFADVGDLLINEQDVGIVELRGHVVLVVDEVGGEVAAVELHAFHHFEFVIEAGALFHGDDAFLAHLLHGLSDEGPDGVIGVGRDGADLGNGLGVGAGGGQRLDFLDRFNHGLVDAALEVHGIHASGHGLEAFVHDGLSQHGGRGGAVTGLVGSARSHFLHHLRTHVFELVFEFDFLGHGHAVLGHRGGAKGLIENHVAALGTEGHLDRIGQDVHALEHALPGAIAKLYVFRAHVFPLSNACVCRKGGWLA